MISNELIKSGFTFAGVLISAYLTFWLAYTKFKNDIKKESKEQKKADADMEVLAVAGILKANADLRDELRKDYDTIKIQLNKKTEEADMAWTQLRDCHKNRAAIENGMAALRLKHSDLECAFHEFKRVCEINHGAK